MTTHRAPATHRAPTRLAKGVGALILLILVVAGIPWLLVQVGHLPDPHEWSGRGFVRLWTRPDGGTVLLQLITVVAWLAWLVFAVALALEVLSVASGHRIRVRLPGLGGAQFVAGGLLVAVIAMTVAPLQAAATPTPPPSRDPSVAAQTPDRHQAGPPSSHGKEPTRATTAGSRDQAPQGGRHDTVDHTVQSGDDLWSLAEHFYGDGGRWRDIAAANRDLLTGGPDELIVGWTLTIPHPTEHVEARERPATVVVAPGDTLTGLAQRHYGDAGQWRAIFDHNRDVIHDPDELQPGWVLVLPTSAPSPDNRESPARDRAAAPGRADGRTSDDGATSAARSADDSEATENAKTGAESATEAPPASHPTRPPAEHSPAHTAPAAPGTTTADRSPRGRATQPPQTGAPARTVRADGMHPGVLGAAALGGLLSTALVGGLVARRQRQLLHRPVGRRIPHPGPRAQHLESVLAGQADSASTGDETDEPLTAAALDLALRAIACHVREHRVAAPDLQLVELSRRDIVFHLGDKPVDPPIGFLATATGWRVERSGIDYLRTVPGVDHAPRLWPALSCVGESEQGARILINLEHAGILGLETASPADRAAALTALVLDLSFAPWSESVRITVVGAADEQPPPWLEALGLHTVTWTTDLARLFDRVALRASAQRALPGGESLPWRRLERATADAWDPEILVFTRALPAGRENQVTELTMTGRPVSLAAVMPGPVTGGVAPSSAEERDPSGPRKRWTLRLANPSIPGRLEPAGLDLTAIRVPADLTEPLADLVATTGREDTLPAPWWRYADRDDDPADRDARADPDDPADREGAPHVDVVPVLEGDDPVGAAEYQPRRASTVRYLSSGVPADGTDQPAARQRTHPDRPPRDHPARDHPARDHSRPDHSRPDHPRPDHPRPDHPRHSEASPTVTEQSPVLSATVPSTLGATSSRAEEGDSLPLVRILGPIDMVGAAGRPPSRAARQCVEYCVWLLQHPGATAVAMADALCVAETTRRSNMSRLRSWLGEDHDGRPYLPDAYTGSIALNPVVSSDWHRLQLLIGGGINRTRTRSLVGALELVRGAPLADAAPGQWYWAEELRSDIVSTIRDIGVTLARRATRDGDLDLARWTAARALVAAPADELLMCERIRTEHRAGNFAEVERLILQVQGRARSLGMDLQEETIVLMQVVLEGRPRARRA